MEIEARHDGAYIDATEQVMLVEPDDPHDAYTFRDRYIYGFVQNSKP